MTPAAKGRSQGRPEVTPADAVFLVIVFLAICAVFAATDGLSLQLPRGAEAFQVTAFPDGRLAANGGPTTIESVESAVRSAVALNPGILVVVRRASGTSPGLVIDVLDRVKRAGASRISIKEIGRAE